MGNIGKISIFFIMFVFTIIDFSESNSSKILFVNAIDRFSDEYRFEGLSSIFIYDDELYVVDNGGSHIYIFGLDGTPIFQFGKEKGVFSPIDVFVSNNYIYVSGEGKNSIDIFNIRGEKLGSIEPPYDGFTPGKMALIPPLTKGIEGFLVVDRNSLKICVFDNDGKYQYNFGGRNFLKSIGGIAVKDGKVYVSDINSDPAIRIFDIKGKYITGFGHIGEGEQNFSMPSGIKVDNNGMIWVVDAFKHRVTGFNDEGKKMNWFGIYGNPMEDLYYPLGIDFKGENFYVVEKGRGRVSMFKRVE